MGSTRGSVSLAARVGLMGLLVTVMQNGLLAEREVSRGQDEMERLIRDLGADDDSVRAQAIESLSKKKKKKEKQRLLGELGSNSASGRVRVGVIEALGKMKRPGIRALEEHLLQPIRGSSIDVIGVSLTAIGDAGPAAVWAAPPLIKLIERKAPQAFIEVHQMVRCLAIMSLGRLGPSGKKTQAVLKRQFKDEELEVRLSSACALWWTGSDPDLVYPVFLEGLEATGDKVSLERAIYGLGEMGTRAREAVPALEELRARVERETDIGIQVALRKIRGLLPPRGPRPGEKSE
jgi:HEAT repeat protein